MSERKRFFQLGSYHYDSLLTDYCQNNTKDSKTPYMLSDLRETQLMRESMLVIVKMFKRVLLRVSQSDNIDDIKEEIELIIEDLSSPPPDITGQHFLPTDQPLRLPTSEFVDWILEEQHKWT
jgi:hypothetical protein